MKKADEGKLIERQRDTIHGVRVNQLDKFERGSAGSIVMDCPACGFEHFRSDPRDQFCVRCGNVPLVARTKESDEISVDMKCPRCGAIHALRGSRCGRSSPMIVIQCGCGHLFPAVEQFNGTIVSKKPSSA